MYLRYVFFHPNWESRSIKEYNRNILQRFQYNCYFVDHYLSIAVRKKRFLTDGTYNSIGVYFYFSMIYTTNWIERLQKDFRRVTRMRGAMPDEDSVIVLMGKTAMDKDAYTKVIPRMREDKTLFPND